MLFETAVIIKGVDAALEMVGGTLLFFVTPDQLHRIAEILTLHELTKDPDDILANYVRHAAERLSPAAANFGAIYLVVHGLIKVGLVTALLLNWRRAYPVAAGAFLLFFVYLVTRYTHTHAPELLVLAALDVPVILLTWLEYRRFQPAKGG
jgi:uncharacterized membrane protein